jgi:hypothetical protein
MSDTLMPEKCQAYKVGPYCFHALDDAKASAIAILLRAAVDSPAQRDSAAEEIVRRSKEVIEILSKDASRM